jgi:hypothetical protein
MKQPVLQRISQPTGEGFGCPQAKTQWELGWMAQPVIERLDNGLRARKDCWIHASRKAAQNGIGSKKPTGDLQRQGKGLVLGS